MPMRLRCHLEMTCTVYIKIHGNREIPQLFYTYKLQWEANSVLSLWHHKPSLNQVSSIRELFIWWGDFQTLIAICCNTDKAIATSIYQHWFKCNSVHHKLGSKIWGGDNMCCTCSGNENDAEPISHRIFFCGFSSALLHQSVLRSHKLVADSGRFHCMSLWRWRHSCMLRW